MSNGKRLVNLRMTDEEIRIIDDYCERTGRTRTDVLREFVRGLAEQPTLPRRAALRPPTKVKRKTASLLIPPARRAAGYG
jgi:hypothetical protein